MGFEDFPRDRTLVVSHWSDSYRPQHKETGNFNWWLPGNSHARHAAGKGLIEHFFYTNLNDGEIIPWLGESFEYNDALDEIDVKTREGVKWSDGVDFTAHDVKFTIDMVTDNAPHLYRSSRWADKIADVTVHDDYNLTIRLTRPAFLPSRIRIRLGEPRADSSKARLGEPGSAHVHEFRPRQGLAVGHGCVLVGDVDN